MQKIEPNKLSLTDRVSKLNNLILHGYLLEAFEKFYAENMTKQENDNEPLVGKDTCRKAAEHFVTNISEFRSAIVKNVIISNNISVVEWEFDLTHKDWGIKKYTQISMHKWNCDGEIINEIIFNHY